LGYRVARLPGYRVAGLPGDQVGGCLSGVTGLPGCRVIRLAGAPALHHLTTWQPDHLV